MSFITDNAKDAFLSYITGNAETHYILSAEPANYTEIATYALGSKASPSFGSIGDYAGGRQVQRDAISGGTVSVSGTAAYEALADDTGTELLTAVGISSSQVVTSGNEYTMTAKYIQVPDPS